MRTRLYILLCLIWINTRAWGQEWNTNGKEYSYSSGLVEKTSSFKVKLLKGNDNLLKKKDGDGYTIGKDKNNNTLFEIVIDDINVNKTHKLSVALVFDDKTKHGEQILSTRKTEKHYYFAIKVPDDGSHKIEIKFFGSVVGNEKETLKGMGYYNNKFSFIKEKPSQAEECKSMYAAVDKKSLTSINNFISEHCKECEEKCKWANNIKQEIESKNLPAVTTISATTSDNLKGGTKPINSLPNSNCKTKWETTVNKNSKDAVKSFLLENCPNGSTCDICSFVTIYLQKLENQEMTKIGTDDEGKPDECISIWEKVNKKDKKAIRTFRKKYCVEINACDKCGEAQGKEDLLIKRNSTPNERGDARIPVPPPCQIGFASAPQNNRIITLSDHKEIALEQMQLEVKDDKGLLSTKHNISLVSKGSATYEIVGGKGTEEIKIITSDCGFIIIKLNNPPLKARPILTGDTISFNISGGTSPYYFMIEDNDDFLIGVGEIKEDKLNIKQWLTNREEDDGKYHIQYKDADNQEGIEHIIYNHILVKPTNWFLWGSIGFILIAGLSYTYYSQHKKKKEAKAKELQADYIERENAKKENEAVNVILMNKKEEEYTEGDKNAIQEKSIIIKSKKTGTAPLKDGKKHNYVKLSMNQLWNDSLVDIVQVSYTVVSEIYNFVNTENDRSRDAGEETAEVGGFLLGSKLYNLEKLSYEISIDKFVATQAQDNNVYKMTFGLDAAKELDKIREENKGLETIGWFHTHPGHGLFLSQPDMRIHDSFFVEQFQIALEIDSLTPDLDAAIFTRKKTGDVNNKQDLKADATLLKWTDLDKATRRRF